MNERAGIVAVAQTRYSSCRNDVRTEELAHEVVRDVMEQTGLSWSEDGRGIHSSVTVSDDFWECRTISEAPLGDVVGAHNHDTLKIAQDGSLGVLYSAASVLSGHDDIVLLVGVCKESQILSRNILTSHAFDPIFTHPLGIDYLSAAAMQARRYMHRYGITREQCARVVVKNRKNAKLNPLALAPADLAIEDIIRSQMLASPISELDVYPVSDGACAMILATEEKAKKLTNKPIWITGVGTCRDAYGLGERDLADCDSLVSAAQQAFRMAGINNPARDIDVVELSEQYSYQELLWSEGLGLCGKGKGGELIDSGQTHIGGKIPINPSGGVLSGVPTLVAGLSRVAEAVLQLRGEAGERQIEGAKVALAHGMTGPCGQMHCVIILNN